MNKEKLAHAGGYWLARGYWSFKYVLAGIPGFEDGTRAAALDEVSHDWDETPRTTTEQFAWVKDVVPNLLSIITATPNPKTTWTQADDDLMNGEDK